MIQNKAAHIIRVSYLISKICLQCIKRDYQGTYLYLIPLGNKATVFLKNQVDVYKFLTDFETRNLYTK